MRTRKEIKDLYDKFLKDFQAKFQGELSSGRLRELSSELLRRREEKIFKQVIDHIPDCDLFAFNEYVKSPEVVPTLPPKINDSNARKSNKSG